MLFRSCGLCVSMMFLSFQAVANTVSIDYTATNLGSGVYQYDYSVFNNGSLGAGVPIQLFDIFFDPTFYQSLSIVTTTEDAAPLVPQWSEMILNSVGSIPPYFDAFALTGGIPVGSTVSGFTVQFAWLGQSPPGSQAFQIYDANTFALLQSGVTVAASAVPEPSTFGMLGIVLAYGARKILRKRA